MHVRETGLKNYIENRLTPEERQVVEQHLADCTSCRQALLAHHREVRIAEDEPLFVEHEGGLANEEIQAALAVGERAARPSRGWPLAAVLALAVLGGSLWTVQQREEAADSPPESVFRLDETPQTLELVAPSEGSPVSPGPVQLRWKAVLDVTEYRVWVLDAAGVPLVNHRTTVNEWMWPGHADGAFWYVEAQFEDGSMLESEAWQLNLGATENVGGGNGRAGSGASTKASTGG